MPSKPRVESPKDFDPQASVSIAKCKSLKVGLRGRPLRFANETAKKNPNSLRFLIGHLVNFFFNGERKEAGEKLQTTSGKYASDRRDRTPKTMDEETLSKILNDESYIYYWQLEAISKAIGIPSGELLTLSRVYSLLRDQRTETAISFVRGLRDFTEHLEHLIKNPVLSKESLDQMVRCFDEAHRLDTHEPPLFDHVKK